MPTNLCFFLAVYRASFPKTFKEIRAGSGHYKYVLPMVVTGVIAGIALAQFLKKTGKT